MPVIYSADLTASTPASITTVNTDASNILDNSGFSPGLQRSNASTDGFDILGWYHTAGVSALPGMVFECTFNTNIPQASDSRFSVWGIGTQASLDAVDDNYFSIYRSNTNVGIGCTMGSEAFTAPDDVVYVNYSTSTIYTARIRLQADGSAKAYIIDPAAPTVEIFLGSSYKGVFLQTPFTPGTTVHFAANGWKSWGTGNQAAVNNAISVSFPAGGGDDGSTAFFLLDDFIDDHKKRRRI